MEGLPSFTRSKHRVYESFVGQQTVNKRKIHAISFSLDNQLPFSKTFRSDAPGAGYVASKEARPLRLPNPNSIRRTHAIHLPAHFRYCLCHPHTAVGADGLLSKQRRINTIVTNRRGPTGGGEIYIYEKPTSGWQTIDQTVGLTTDSSCMMSLVAFSGDTVVGGQLGCTGNGIFGSGALFIYVKPAGGWSDMTETAPLSVANIPDDFAILATSVAAA